MTDTYTKMVRLMDDVATLLGMIEYIAATSIDTGEPVDLVRCLDLASQVWGLVRCCDPDLERLFSREYGLLYSYAGSFRDDVRQMLRDSTQKEQA